MSSRSRSRSRSSSRSPKRYRRSNRDDSMSPIRTASGASLRTPKNYNSGGYGYRNYNYRGGYNNRGYYNQRYNYGRWNRGRGNFRGGWQNRNQWNQRNRYNSRSDRSRSRSRSRSYDRDRSRSSSYSRSRSRSRSQSHDRDKRDRRRRSRSVKSSERRTDRPKSKSKSKSPPKTVEMPPEQPPPEEKLKPEKPPQNIEVPSTVPDREEEKQPEEPHFAETAAFTRSRWESPDVTSGGIGQQTSDMDLEQDQLFDQWDDDKLREYLLKSKGKKLGKDTKKLLEEANAPAEAETTKTSKQKKKKRSKSSTKSPSKETRGRKKKRASKQARSSSESGSSSSSFSPIHKAPQPHIGTKTEAEPTIPSETLMQQNQDYTQTGPNVYAQQQVYPTSSERTQAVQYPFSHIRKPTPPISIPMEPTPPPPVPAVSYPAPVPAPQPPQSSAPPPPVIGEMQVLGPDGRPMRLVPTSVPGPDGKMIQVMQVVQDTAPPAPPQVSAPPPLPVTKPKQEYRTPPPPPSYPPPTGIGKYTTPTTDGVNTSSEMYMPEGFTDDDMAQTGYGHQGFQKQPPPMTTVHTKDDPRHEKHPYEQRNHASSLKKMEMEEKQKRRQDVVKTRFTPRPAAAWAQDVKQEKEEVKVKDSMSDSKTRGHAIPSLADPANRAKRPTHEEFVSNFPPDGNGTEMMRGRPEKKTIPMPTQQMKGPSMMQGGVLHSNVQNPPAKAMETDIQPITAYPNVPPPSYSQVGYNSVQGNQQYFMGPNGERLQMPPIHASPQAVSAPRPPPVQRPVEPFQSEKQQSVPKQQPNWGTPRAATLHKKQKPDTEKDVSSDEEGENNLGAPQRKRTISTGSDRKSKKKLKSVSSDESDDDEQTKRKKEKKKKKKNKKKKDQGNDEVSSKEKKKKKEKKQKEKTEMISLEHETIKSKKDLKAFEEVKRKTKVDDLIRTVSDDLPLSHIRGIVPRRKDEASEPLLRYVKVEAPPPGKTNVASSTSYEDRFVSLFGSSEPEVKAEETEQRIDITKKSVRKFKVQVKGTRDVTHMTGISLSNRIKQISESDDVSEEKEVQKVSLNVSSISKASQSTQSQSRSRSRSRSHSSSASSDSPKKAKKSKKKKRRSRTSSRSRSRSKSRSVSLPRAYSGMDDKSGKRGRSRSKDYSDSDLRHDLDKRKAARNRSDSRSRSRSRSYSSDEDRNRNRGRQMYQNRNNQGYYYNNRGRGRGYFQNYRGGGRGWYNNRGNFRGRWNNWNNQGWNRNQGYRYGRYDNRHRDRSRDRSHSRSRSRSRDDRSSSRERDEKKDRRDSSPRQDEKATEQQPQTGNQEQAPQANNGKPVRQPSPAQWDHDMFEEHDAGDKKAESAN